jgi:peptide/nickel transport system permease protein
MIKKFPLLLVLFSSLTGLFLFDAPTNVDLDSSYCPSFQLAHPLGCDRLGRDHYSLLVYGLWVTIIVAFPARLFTIFFSFLISLVASYLSNFWKDLVNSTSAVFLSIPSLLIALIVVSIFQASYFSFLLAIALSDWASVYETIQVKIREIKESKYVQVSRNLGAGNYYIFTRHILPELKNILVNLFVTGIPAVIMTVAIFSYLGVDFANDLFGPGLGEQISFSKDYAHVSPASLLIPVFGIIVLVLSVQLASQKISDKSN